MGGFILAQKFSVQSISKQHILYKPLVKGQIAAEIDRDCTAGRSLIRFKIQSSS